MKVLIVGGSGYIGSHLAVLLLSLGHKVYIYDKDQPPEYLKGKVDYTTAWTSDVELLSLIFTSFNPDVVVDMAAYISVSESVKDPLMYYSNNVYTVLNVLKLANEYGAKYIFSSTAAVYAPSNNMIDESGTISPSNPYAKSKYMCEHIIRDFASVHSNFQYVIFRYFNVAGADPELRVGPNLERSHHLVSNIMRTVFDIDQLVIFGNDYDTPDGTGIRDYIHVMDLAQIHYDIMISGIVNDVINCGYGSGFSVLDVINAATEALGKTIWYKFGVQRPGDVSSVVANVHKLDSLNVWTPKYNSIQSIILTAYMWERNQRGELYDI